MYEDISSVVFDKFFLTRLLGGGGWLLSCEKKVLTSVCHFFYYIKRKRPYFSAIEIIFCILAGQEQNKMFLTDDYFSDVNPRKASHDIID
jgi:hypothetical protein